MYDKSKSNEKDLTKDDVSNPLKEVAKAVQKYFDELSLTEQNELIIYLKDALVKRRENQMASLQEQLNQIGSAIEGLHKA